MRILKDFIIDTTGTRNCYFPRISNICYSFLLGDCFMLAKIKLEFYMRTEDSATGPCYWSRLGSIISVSILRILWWKCREWGLEGMMVGWWRRGPGLALIKRARERLCLLCTQGWATSTLTEHKLSVRSPANSPQLVCQKKRKIPS